MANAGTTGQQSFNTLFPRVLAGRGCTQEDAPAIEIYFFDKATEAGEPAAPYVRVEISGSARERMKPGTFQLMPLHRSASDRGRIVRAELVEKPGSSAWLAGTIAIRSDDPEAGISGRADLISPKGESWSRTFTAQYRVRRALCG